MGVEGRSRGSSQEPRPGKSPTPARATPQPPSEPPLAPVDPKVAKLDKINEEVESLMEKIRNFSGSKQDKEYLYLDEMLTRHLIALGDRAGRSVGDPANEEGVNQVCEHVPEPARRAVHSPVIAGQLARLPVIRWLDQHWWQKDRKVQACKLLQGSHVKGRPDQVEAGL